MQTSNPKMILPNPSCGYCDFGLVMASIKIFPAVHYCFLCSCPIGQRRQEHYPRWTFDHKKNFEILEPSSQRWDRSGPTPT